MQALLKQAITQLRKKAVDRCFYLDDKLRNLAGEQVSVSLGKFSVIILSRRGYYESTRDFPISSRWDLRKAIDLDPSTGPFKGRRLFQAASLNEGGHRVIRWILRPNLPISEKNNSLKVTIPESALLRRTQSEEIASYQCVGGILYVQCRNNSVKSLYVPEHDTQLLRTAAQSLGESEHRLSALTPIPLFQALKDALSQLTTKDLVAFTTLDLRPSQPIPWKTLSASLGIAATLYFSTTSALLWGRAELLRKEIERRGAEIEASSSKEQRVRALQQELTEMQGVAENISPAWAALPPLIVLKNVGYQFRNIKFDGERLTIYGTGDSAADVFTFLEGSPIATGVEFVEPVRKRANKEQFAIAFTPIAPAPTP